MQDQKVSEPLTNPTITPLTDPIAPQPTTTSPLPPVSQSPKSNKKMLMIIGVVIVLIILTAVGIFAFTQMNKPAETIMQPSPTPEAMIDVSDWGVYEGEGYSLQYPSTFTISDTEENGAKGITLLMHGETQKNSGRTQTELFDGVVIKTLLITKTDNQPLSDYANNEYQTAKSSLDPNSNDYFTDLTKTTIAGKEAYMYDIHGYSDAKIYYMSVGENVLKIIVIYAGSDTDVPGYLSLADQILSTFKFTQ